WTNARRRRPASRRLPPPPKPSLPARRPRPRLPDNEQTTPPKPPAAPQRTATRCSKTDSCARCARRDGPKLLQEQFDVLRRPQTVHRPFRQVGSRDILAGQNQLVEDRANEELPAGAEPFHDHFLGPLE